LADVFEALTGAIFLDGGLVAAQNFVLRSFAGDLETLRTSPLELNPKGELQEIIQSIGNTPPSYAILSSDGPDHLKSFIALVSWLGAELGRGTGRSKKEAESEAARDALNQPDLHARLQSAKSRPKEGGNNV
jgi:ribonuclease-3